MEMNGIGVIELRDEILNGEITSVQATEYYLDRIRRYKYKNAVLEVFDDAIDRARAVDEEISAGAVLPLGGIPILIKDNIMYKGKICSNASKSLEHYKAQYNATVIDKLLSMGCVILGRTNMDEFAMGGSCENSAFGPCKNAHDNSRVSGGSSGGSAVAVALEMCAFALGSDTGGSVRQPASYNGVVGIKPTFGRVSRFGLTAYAGSLDTIGIFTRNVKDNAYIMSLIAGRDVHDPKTSEKHVPDYLSRITGNIKGKKIAIVKEVQELVSKTDYAGVYQEAIDYCQKYGAIVTKTSIPDFKSILPAYYTIAFAEGSSNLARIDGVRYGDRLGDRSISEVYTKTRSKLLGREVKRRIMLGNFVLSSEHYNSYYVKAKEIAEKVRAQFKQIFKNNDVIFMPTTYGEAFELGAKTADPLSMYIEDMFTVTANIVGVPSISVPIGKGKNNLPIGLQILGNHFEEEEVYNMADFVSQRGDWNE
ncbi:MAG: Asp-tRNA(Asn)/Glu-tRNA(Gln) amidotransferase subunit GatA [Clostridia bacterium]|nr:Asp-tRNA(Asn)/Glu-tRNA(Gln) amidotransferase subunit GatA [Clostridia bacterium]